jgi:Tfp pilus assembly protein PilX
MKTPILRPAAGSTLIAVIIAMVVVAGLVSVTLNTTTYNARMAKHSVDRAQMLAYADGIMEHLFDQWRNAIITVTNSTDRTQGLSNSSLASVLVAPTSTQLPPPTNISLVSWSVQAATPQLVALTATTDRPLAENGTKSSLLTRLNYLATVTVRTTAPGGSNTLTLQRNFVRGGKNFFSYFYFSTQPVTEMHPGPPMYISGTCYINGDLYTAQNSLHFLQDVTFTGSQFLNYRTNDSRYGSTTPDITSGGLGDNWNLTAPPHVGQSQKLFDVPFASLDPNFTDDPIANDTDSNSNPNDNGYREIIDEAVSGYTDPLQLDPSLTERLVSTADYRIVVNASNTVTIYKGTSTTALSTTGAEYTAIKNALTTNTALYDPREGDNVRTVTLDVGAITTAYSTGTITDNNNANDGLTFYIKDSSAGSSVTTNLGTTSVTSSRSRAVKLTNGAKLPYNTTNGTGFSIISPNPVYIQGDYNTGTTGSTKPASNTATSYTPPVDTPSPTVSGYTKAPAAVLGDSINILSNSWSDANSTSSGPSGSGPTATSTTINCAMLGGNVPTTSSSYSGGVENFTRFLEDWSGSVYLTIYGAIAPLYNSEQAKGTWGSARYSPPQRRWYYDPLLQNNNPPGFHVARSYERGRRVVR